MKSDLSPEWQGDISDLKFTSIRAERLFSAGKSVSEYGMVKPVKGAAHIVIRAQTTPNSGQWSMQVLGVVGRERTLQGHPFLMDNADAETRAWAERMAREARGWLAERLVRGSP